MSWFLHPASPDHFICENGKRGWLGSMLQCSFVLGKALEFIEPLSEFWPRGYLLWALNALLFSSLKKYFHKSIVPGHHDLLGAALSWGWNWVVSKVPYDLSHSMILWFYYSVSFWRSYLGMCKKKRWLWIPSISLTSCLANTVDLYGLYLWLRDSLCESQS